MGKIADKLQERYGLAQKAQALVKKADDEKREMTTEERTQFDTIMADVDKIKNDVDILQKDEEARKAIAGILENPEKKNAEQREAVRTKLKESEELTGRKFVEDFGEKASSADMLVLRNQHRALFNRYLEAAFLIGNSGSTEERNKLFAFQEKYRKDISYGLRALQMDVDTSGGYTVVPQQFVAELIEMLKAITFFRTIAKQYLVPGAESLGAPALDARPADPTWTGEILTGNEDSTMKFGKRELHPHPLAQRLKVSKKLIRASALNMDQVVRDQLAYKCAIVEETAFMSGTGANQPLGIFVASNYGIDTSRDISTGNTTTAITADGLIECKYNLRPVYWARSKWIFHYSAIKNIRKLRGNDGDFLWKAGLSNDKGDTILDCPVLVSEFAPSTFTTGQYVGILGDFDFYYIADALDVTIQVLTELYAETNQNGYIIRKETDGMPVLAEAFARVTLA